MSATNQMDFRLVRDSENNGNYFIFKVIQYIRIHATRSDVTIYKLYLKIFRKIDYFVCKNIFFTSVRGMKIVSGGGGMKISLLFHGYPVWNISFFIDIWLELNVYKYNL